MQGRSWGITKTRREYSTASLRQNPTTLVTPLDYPGANFTIAQGINSAGTIAGDFSNDGGNTTHGFLDNNGTFTQFDVPGSKPGSTVRRLDQRRRATRGQLCPNRRNPARRVRGDTFRVYLDRNEQHQLG